MNESRNWIRQARKSRGMTGTQLGRVVGVTEAAISQIETGICTPSVTTLYRIAVELDNRAVSEALAPFVAADGGTLYKKSDAK